MCCRLLLWQGPSSNSLICEVANQSDPTNVPKIRQKRYVSIEPSLTRPRIIVPRMFECKLVYSVPPDIHRGLRCRRGHRGTKKGARTCRAITVTECCTVTGRIDVSRVRGEGGIYVS